MNARFYSASSGRFLSQDTYRGNAWEPMSQNLYTYVGNNPINYVDPTGHDAEAIDDQKAKALQDRWAKYFEYVEREKKAIIEETGLYGSMDDAAIAWANTYMPESVDRDLEYGTIIYKQQFALADGTTVSAYGYGKLITGTKYKVNTALAIIDEDGNITLPDGVTVDMVEAYIHTHGNNLDETAHTFFSRGDKKGVEFYGYGYLVFRPEPNSSYGAIRKGNSNDIGFDTEIWNHYNDGTVDRGYQGRVIPANINIG